MGKRFIYLGGSQGTHQQAPGGTVKMRSSNPMDLRNELSSIFDESNDSKGEDLQAVVEGVKSINKSPNVRIYLSKPRCYLGMKLTKKKS